MSPRSVSVLTLISLAALTAAACSPKLAASRDAPNPPVSGPPLRVDLIHPGDQPDGPPLPPADAPVDMIETDLDAEGAAEQVADAGPTMQPSVTAVAVAEPGPPNEAEAELIPVAHVEPVPARALAGSHCQVGEAAVYSCRFQDGRVLSICRGDQIAYRFGRLGAPELDLVRQLGSEAVSYDVAPRRGEGRQTRIQFRNGNHDYVVYSSQTGGRDELQRPGRSGVFVRRGGREIARFDCPTASDQTLIPASMLRDMILTEPSERRLRGR
jgi:hypothetical protein